MVESLYGKIRNKIKDFWTKSEPTRRKIGRSIKKTNKNVITSVKNTIRMYLEEIFFISSFTVLDITFFIYLGNFVGLITLSIILFIIGAYITFIRSR